MKTQWTGRITGIQPRIRLTRSFDQRYHTYLGYVLRLSGSITDEETEFLVAVGKTAHAKHQFQVGDVVAGESEPVADEELETAQLYKTAKLRILERHVENIKPPPWAGVPPDLDTYRARGHRRLAAKTYEAKCLGCIWGSLMPVELIIDQWNPSNRKYRRETFCYGPKSCTLYRPGPTRKVPGRKGMSWEEEDWVDDQATEHRSMDE